MKDYKVSKIKVDKGLNPRPQEGDGNPGIIGCFRVACPSFLRACNPCMGFAKGISVRKSPLKGRGWNPWDYPFSF
jgi:hypothetical protein